MISDRLSCLTYGFIAKVCPGYIHPVKPHVKPMEISMEKLCTIIIFQSSSKKKLKKNIFFFFFFFFFVILGFKIITEILIFFLRTQPTTFIIIDVWN